MKHPRSVQLQVAEHLADHDGVITTAQASALGMPPGQVRSRRESGLWTPHGRSTFLSAEHRMTDMARVRIVSSTHRGAVVDRTSAAFLHGLTDHLPDEVTVSVPRSGTRESTCQVAASIRRRTFPAEDLAVVKDVVTTGLPLTVLAAAAEIDDGIAMMDRALQTKSVSLQELRAALERNAGAHGMHEARTLLAAAEDLSESELERKFVRFLHQNKISGWHQQVWIGNRRLDFAWPAEQIAVSLHGWAFHHQHDRWEADQATANSLLAIGWLPLSFTWKRLVYHPDQVLSELSQVLELRRSVG